MSKFKESFIRDNVSTKNGHVRENVVAPAYGLDTSVVQLSSELAMTVASDPLSLIPGLGLERSAWLSLHLAANDIATTSFAPQYGQLVLNVPETIREDELITYWNYIDQFAKDIELSITGGHTGWCQGNRSTIAGGITLWAFAPPKDILLSSGAEVGDVLLMTKSAALSSSAILAIVFPQLSAMGLSDAAIQELQQGFWSTSVRQEAAIVRRINAKHAAVTAMHDVTEGGVIGAIHEFCTSCGLGLRLQESAIPVAPAVQQLCDLLQLDPLRSIGAGAMLISCKPDYQDILIQEMEREDIPCRAIGHFVAPAEGRFIDTLDGQQIPLEGVEQDPYWNVFYTMMNHG